MYFYIMLGLSVVSVVAAAFSVVCVVLCIRENRKAIRLEKILEQLQQNK